MRALAIWCLLIPILAAAQTAPPAIQTTSLPTGAVRQLYYQRLQATDGVAALHWRVTAGELPPAITLDPSGVLSGVPTAAGDYRFTVTVTDSAQPPRSASREFLLRIPPALTMTWTPAPSVQNGGISGRVEVTNGAGDTLDLTVIIVAVNEIGKAFALGYQHHSQPAGSRVIDFGSTLPAGDYVVNADAIGESAGTSVVYHVRLVTPEPLTVP